MFNKKFIGQKVRQLRTDNNVRQDVLAAKIDMSKQMLSNIETGYRDATLDVFVALADFFKVPLDYLAGRGPYEQPDGILPYHFLGPDGGIIKGVFCYSFGIFPVENIGFTPRFLFLEETEGDFLHRILSSKSQFEFLSLIYLLNDRLHIGYRLDADVNGEHSVKILIKAEDEWSRMNPLPVFKELKSGTGMPVVLVDIFAGYESFVRNYLKMTTAEKIEFLARFASNK